MSDKRSLSSLVTRVFWLAGAVNVIGVLVVSQFFTNALPSSLDPATFSSPGLVAVMLWGLAYAAVATSYASVPWLVLVFAAEKALYVVCWLTWISREGSTLPSVFSQSPLTAAFLAIYGPIDFAFGSFFLWVALRSLRAHRTV